MSSAVPPSKPKAPLEAADPQLGSTPPLPRESPSTPEQQPDATGNATRDAETVVRSGPPAAALYRAPDPLAWRSHPLWDQAPASWLWIVLLLSIAITTATMTGSLGWAAVACGVLVAGSPSVWLPTRYEVSRRGVTIRRLGLRMSIPWRTIGSYRIDRRGVLLLPHRRTRPTDFLAAVHVPWGPHGDQLLAAVVHHLGHPDGSTSHSGFRP